MPGLLRRGRRGPLAVLAVLPLALPAAQAPAQEASPLAECLISNSTERDHEVFRHLLIAALTDAPDDLLRETMQGFSESIVRLGVRECGVEIGEFQTERGKQAASLYGQWVGRKVAEAAFARLQQ